ncbi:22828_t:CDS:2, partial [Dentiscutata erythropus]
MITKHKQTIHAKKLLQKNENQTSISDFALPIVLIEHVELPYLSTEEVIESLEYLDNDNHQIQLSNSTFMENFSNLPSIQKIKILAISVALRKNTLLDPDDNDLES